LETTATKTARTLAHIAASRIDVCNMIHAVESYWYRPNCHVSRDRMN